MKKGKKVSKMSYGLEHRRKAVFDLVWILAALLGRNVNVNLDYRKYMFRMLREQGLRKRISS